MAKISDHVVMYYPSTREVVRENPPLRREVLGAREQMQANALLKDVKQALNWAGLGRIKWSVVESYTKKDVADFQRRYEIFDNLVGNTKTVKPRPSGRHGVIKGLALAPHFYPNLLTQIELDKQGHLARFDKRWFNGFDGTDSAAASAYASTPKNDLLNFCVGSSQWCRQTCLVLTGNNPASNEATRKKLKLSWALLEEPELFVAMLNKELGDFAEAGRRGGFDPVVRLNMLSDLPWYALCPELLGAHEGRLWHYDYTKVPFWRFSEYQKVSHLIDYTFSFSGGNDALCKEALKHAVRIAVVFASADPERGASVSQRTTFKEIVENSGLIGADGKIDLFGGRWLFVDGDDSDYRIDDPPASIVGLNFKDPNVKEERLQRALPTARAHFAVPVPDPHGTAQRYIDARNQKFWDKLGVDPTHLPIDEVIRIAEERADPEAWDSLNVLPEGVGLAMAPVEGTQLLIGPHVPTVLND